AEVLLKGLVHSFSLAVSLRVVGGQESDLDVERLAQGGPEFGDKEGTLVGDYIVRKSVLSEDVLEEQFGELWG
ncbi:hypothetical protein C0992_002455, partial [Termitomyces sp. T32_za158]